MTVWWFWLAWVWGWLMRSILVHIILRHRIVYHSHSLLIPLIVSRGWVMGKDCGLRPLEHLTASIQTPQILDHQKKDNPCKTPFPKTQKPLTPKARPLGTISKDGRGPAQLVVLLSLSHHSTNLGRGLRWERHSRENSYKQYKTVP